jgi:DNA polymerase I-like protein with 3'-5' exonuclease and polymerase domains
MPPIPDTGWRPPTEFPRLDAASRIAIDCETYDPTLLSKGPGVRTGGYIVGLAIGTDDARWYFPMRHSVQSEMNLDPDAVMHWARDQLRDARQPKVGAHLLYDLDFLAEAGVTVAGPLLDVQIAEPLLDENAPSFSLNALARKHLGESKVEEALYSWAALAYGGPVDRSQASNIHRSPPSLVGPYAEGDVDLPLRILDKQQTQLAAENLTELFDIESRLIPLLLAMRRRGVRVDLDAAQRAYDSFSRRIEHVERGLGGINVFAAEEIAAYCRKHRIEFPLTEKGNPSFTADFLKRHDNALIRSITDVRKWYKTRDTFIKGYILDSHVNGRIHAQFNQLRSDDKGAVSGRFSSSNPNLQNIPARDEEIGPLMRSMFLPDEGESWARFDWSQIEFRFLTHYGRGRGASRAREMYRSNPKTDFHRMVSDLVWPSQPEMRKPAKNINFGLVYGMGEPHMAETLGRTLDEVRPLFETYHTQLPFVKTTYNAASNVAALRGYIITILGRRRRFERWESTHYKERDQTYTTREEALAAHPRSNVRRAFVHKALNALLQGSAADLMKKAMVELWESGLCALLGAPLLTVHDELDLSVQEGRTPLLLDVKHIMENCMTLQVPIIVELEQGPNWGSCV